MAAEIYSTPDAVKVPEIDWNEPIQKYNERCEKFYDELKAWLLKRKKGKNVGEIIRFPVADGKAEYMVASMRPLELVHLPLMDGYEFQYAHLMTAKEVNEKIEADKRLAEFFSKKN